MVYGILSMINFAHGDVFMVGAFLCFLAGTALGLPFTPTLILAMVGAALLGVSIERLAYKPLRNAPRVSAIITALGVGIFLENLTLAFYPYPQNVPSLLENVTWHVGGVSISSLQLTIIGLSFALMLVLDHVVHRTPVGMAMRDLGTGPRAADGHPVHLIISIARHRGCGPPAPCTAAYRSSTLHGDPRGWKAFIAAVVGASAWRSAMSAPHPRRRRIMVGAARSRIGTWCADLLRALILAPSILGQPG
jgi:branched-chain amino acid transport system permease protein